MQEEMVMKFVYSAVIVGTVVVAAVVFAVVWAFYCWLDDNASFKYEPCGRDCTWRLRIGNYSLRWIKHFLMWSTPNNAYFLFDTVTLRKFWTGLWDQVREYSFRITPWRVYFWHIERDCDHYWVEQPLSYPNGWVAWADMNSRFEDAEGPCTFTRITRREYLDSKASWRDAAAEAAGY